MVVVSNLLFFFVCFFVIWCLEVQVRHWLHSCLVWSSQRVFTRYMRFKFIMLQIPSSKLENFHSYIWNSRTIFPCSSMKLLMSSPRAVNIILKKNIGSCGHTWSAAGGGTTAELLEAPACYRSAPARPRSPGLESLPWMPFPPLLE